MRTTKPTAYSPIPAGPCNPDLIDPDDLEVDQLIELAGSFNARAPREAMVNLRFTQAELALVDRLVEAFAEATDREVTRIEVLRDLLALGLANCRKPWRTTRRKSRKKARTGGRR